MKSRVLILLALLIMGGGFFFITYMPMSSTGSPVQLSCSEYIFQEWKNKEGSSAKELKLYQLGGVDLARCHNFDAFLSEYLTANTIDEVDGNGNTALHWAAMSDNEEMMRYLLESKANSNAKNSSGMTPLMLVSRWEEIDLLLKHGAVATNVDNMGYTVLMHNLKKADVSIKGIQLLIQKGADIHAKDKEGHGVVWSFFDIARGDDHSLEALKFLITTGIPLDSIDADGKTLLMHAASRSNSVREVAVLVEHGLPLTAEDKNKRTALFYTLDFFGNAVPGEERQRQLKEYLQFYSSSEVNFNHKDKDGLTVLNYQNRKGNKDIVQMLRSFGAKD